MDVEPKYSFVVIPGKNYPGFNDKNIRNLIDKWGINIMIQNFLFNEPFHQYHKYHLAEAFFKDSTVAAKLKTWNKCTFIEEGFLATDVEVKQIPCSITNMSFFDKLKNPENNIVHKSGCLRQKYDGDIDGILVADNLRAMLLDEECNEYNLYSKTERDEFIFRLFQLIVLGGEFCQYEDNLQPYLDTIRTIYKDLVRIQKGSSDELIISTIVLEVVVKNENSYFPKDPLHKQNIGFFLIDSAQREITTILHQYNRQWM